MRIKPDPISALLESSTCTGRSTIPAACTAEL